MKANPEPPPCWGGLLICIYPCVIIFSILVQCFLTAWRIDHKQRSRTRRRPMPHRANSRPRETREEARQRKYRYLYQVRTARGDIISQVSDTHANFRCCCWFIARNLWCSSISSASPSHWSYFIFALSFRIMCRHYKNVSSPDINHRQSIQPKPIHTNATRWIAIVRIVHISPISSIRTSIKLTLAISIALDDYVDITTTIKSWETTAHLFSFSFAIFMLSWLNLFL